MWPDGLQDFYEVGDIQNEDESSTSKLMDLDTILLWALISAIIVLVTMCLLSCLRCGRRRHHPGSLPASSTIYTVPSNYNAVNAAPTYSGNVPPASNNAQFGHRRISSIGDRFVVPLELLPPNFDYTTPGVEFKGDHVVVKDLKLIQIPTNDEYQKQSPYNPNYT